MTKTNLEPEVILHDNVESPLERAVGYYDSKTEKIHVLEQNIMFHRVLLHEKIHWERRNMFHNRLIDSLIGSERRFLLGLVAFYVYLIVVNNFVSNVLILQILGVSGLLVFVMPITVEMWEEYQVRKETYERIKETYKRIKEGVNINAEVRAI